MTELSPQAVNKAAAVIFDRAADRIEVDGQWIKGRLAEDAAGSVIIYQDWHPISCDKAVRWCASGALCHEAWLEGYDIHDFPVYLRGKAKLLFDALDRINYAADGPAEPAAALRRIAKSLREDEAA